MGFTEGHGAGGNWGRAWGFQEDPGTPDFTAMNQIPNSSPLQNQKM